MPEAIRQANQAHQTRKLYIEMRRKDARKEFRRAFIACRGNDACEDAAEAARDRTYERLGADREAIRKHFMRSEKPAGTVAKPKPKTH